MTAQREQTAAAEWRRHWMVPLAGMVGYSAAGLQAYAFGAFVPSIEASFGWTRAQVMSGLTISGLVGVAINFLVGMAIDRFGPRAVGMTGLLCKCGGFALLATATGALFNWSLLWLVVATGVALINANVWTSSVAASFDRSRGLAIALTLTGSSVAAMIVPLLATSLLAAYGWRTAISMTGLIWLAATLPVVFFLFPNPRKAAVPTAPEDQGADLPGHSLREGLRTAAFWRITAANFSFAFYTLALAPNLLPLLTEKGTSMAVAAQIAALLGVVGLIARLSAGYLLDKFPANLVATVIFLLPVAGGALLLFAEPSYLVLLVAVASFGATIGAEYDIVFYMTSRHFGLKSFGALLGVILTFGSLAGALGPLTAGWLHDRMGNYDGLLIVLMTLMGLSAVAMATMGRPKRDWSAAD